MPHPISGGVVLGTLGSAGGYRTVKVPDMSDTTGTAIDRPRLPRAAVTSAEAFVARHGGDDPDVPVRGVVERLGRRGGKVVLVGADGRIGDVLVPSVAAGERLVSEVPGITAASWDGETVAATRIGPERRRQMAGPRARH